MRIALLALVLGMVGAAHAHGGVSMEDDHCVMRIGPHRAHFTGYQPQTGSAQAFCEDIPEPGRAVIVIDFVDMEVKENRDKVVRSFKDALSRDKTRTQVFNISELGLVEMTRKRIGEGLLETVGTRCATCDGRGVIVPDDLLS